MDTYWNTNYKCEKCGRCIIACQSEGKGFLVGVRDSYPVPSSDYVPCHHCTEKFSKVAPCISVCHYDAIKIERW